jgi:hypothetical protein
MTAKKKKRSPYAGQIAELEKLRDLANEAFVAMVDAYDLAQYNEWEYLTGYIEPLKDALETLEQLTINLIVTEQSE